MKEFVSADPRLECLAEMGTLSASSPRKVRRLTAEKHAASGGSERMITLLAFIIAVNPIGTVIAVHLYLIRPARRRPAPIAGQGRRVEWFL